MNSNIILKNKIKKLKNFLKLSLNKIDKKQCIRNRKLQFSDIFYFSNLYNSNPTNTYDSVYNKVLIENTYDNISKNAFIKKRNNLSIEHFIDINEQLVKYIYNDLNKNKGRLISVDCSNLCFLNKLSDDFNSNKHNTYTNGCLSCLFDVDLQIPINYNLSKSFDERKLLIDQLKYLNNNDILVADRGVLF